MFISRSRYRWSRAGVVWAVQIASGGARSTSSSARASLRVWVAERCWPSRSRAPGQHGQRRARRGGPGVRGTNAGSFGINLVVAGQLGSRTLAGRRVGPFGDVVNT